MPRGLLFIVLVRCPVHTPVRTPMYGLPLNQSDQRIRSVFQSVYNNVLVTICKADVLKYLESSLGVSF